MFFPNNKVNVKYAAAKLTLEFICLTEFLFHYVLDPSSLEEIQQYLSSGAISDHMRIKLSWTVLCSHVGGVPFLSLRHANQVYTLLVSAQEYSLFPGFKASEAAVWYGSQEFIDYQCYGRGN